MVRALAPNRTNHPLHKGSLPGGSRCGQDFVDSHVSYLPAEVIAEDSIGRGVGSAGLGRRNGLPQLLSCPLCGWMVGHAEVDNASAVMGQYQKHVKNLEADSGDSEEVDRNHLGEVVLEEGA